MPLPALRNVEASPMKHEGKVVICLQDPEGFVETPVLLSPTAFAIATLLDGMNEVLDIQYQIARNTGNIISSEDIERVVSYLDEHGYLKSAQFDKLCARVREEFGHAGSRVAYLAGKSYPSEPDELRKYLNDFFISEKGPGRLPDKTAAETSSAKGLIAPHIDFDRGGHVYASAYQRLVKEPTPSTVFVFGVSHAPATTPFILTRKDFETPLGTLKNDREVTDYLAERCAWNPFADEIIHRSEHSIEFQAVMLAHLLGEQVKIVPVLCGLFPENMTDKSDSRVGAINEFLRGVQEIIGKDRKSFAVIAGADLAHVGKRFGDPFDIDEGIIQTVRDRDDEDMGYLKTVNADGWYASVMKDKNERKVCGISCIYAAVKVLEGSVSRGDIIQYDYAPDPFGGIVSFAAVAFS